MNLWSVVITKLIWIAYMMWSQYLQLTNKNKNQAEKTLYSTFLSTKLKVGDNSLHSDVFYQINIFNLRESKYHKHNWKCTTSSFMHDSSLYTLQRSTGTILANPIHFLGHLKPTTCNLYNRAGNLRCALAPPHILFRYHTVHLLSNRHSSPFDKRHNKTAHSVLR